MPANVITEIWKQCTTVVSKDPQSVAVSLKKYVKNNARSAFDLFVQGFKN